MKVQIGFIAFKNNGPVVGPVTVFGQRNMSAFRAGLGDYWLRVGPFPLTGAGLPAADPQNAFTRSQGEFMVNVVLENSTPAIYRLQLQPDLVTWHLLTFSAGAAPIAIDVDAAIHFEVESFAAFAA